MVSVITPSFNSIRFINETIYSVLEQSYLNWELIIVDDHSIDGTYERALALSASEKRIRVLRNREGKKGAASARNTGLSQANGNYIVFLDSDDILTTSCLKQRVAVMETEPQLDFAVFKQETFTSITAKDFALYNRSPYRKGDDYLKMFLRNDNPWTVTCPIWRKDALLKLGGFDEDLVYMEDPELHVRALLSELEFRVVDESSVDCYYRLGSYDEYKQQIFYSNSILSRITFYEKVIQLIGVKNIRLSLYRSSLQKGYINLLKRFMLARLNTYYNEFYSFTRYLYKNKVLNVFGLLKFQSIGLVFHSSNRWVKTFRLKGLIYKFL